MTKERNLKGGLGDCGFDETLSNGWRFSLPEKRLETWRKVC